MRTKKRHLEDHRMPFKERCECIDFYDTIDLEWLLIEEHHEWVVNKLKTAREAGNMRQQEFLDRFRGGGA